MNNSGNGQPPKKETVYSGPVPPAFAQRSSAPAATATQGTVYSGPDPGGTVFDETNFVAKKPDRSLAVAATTSKVRWFALRFFIAAAVSFYEFYIFRDDDSTIAMTSFFVGLVFLAIGVFAMRLSRIAFLVALGIYVLDTVGLFLWAMNSDGGFFFAIKPLIVHGVILHQLYLNYGLLVDLHTD
ncbi:MAG: hypothetical protein L0Z53_19975 [Acidobacteriales bacterium]|nr:hypothetical protein [Terriglobales bacterium]